ADQRLLVQDLADIWANKATTRYKELGDYLLVKYLDGNIKIEDENGFVTTEDKKPVPPKYSGYDEKYYRSIVDDSGDRLKVHELKVKQRP
ncbi:MAG: hypothetical protein K2M25_03150, partial [Muribaculaceae bacterium]|nr:hypothetical protein [Muribaculaceae bacterium]